MSVLWTVAGKLSAFPQLRRPSHEASRRFFPLSPLLFVSAFPMNEQHVLRQIRVRTRHHCCTN